MGCSHHRGLLVGKLQVSACLQGAWHYLDSLVAPSSTRLWPSSNNHNILVGVGPWLAPQEAFSLAILLFEVWDLIRGFYRKGSCSYSSNACSSLRNCNSSSSSTS